jgi:hypothetical protein
VFTVLEVELVRDVGPPVAVVVDVDLVEDVVTELIEIRPPAGVSSGM